MPIALLKRVKPFIGDNKMLPTINFDNQSGVTGEKPVQKNDVSSSRSESGSVSAEKSLQDSDNEVKLSDFHPARARKLLNERILASLNSVLQSDGISKLDVARSDDFTPEKVADRILKFVDSAMKLAKLDGASDEELANMLEEAKKGVDMGFGEAKDILDGFGVLNGKIAEDIDETYDLIQKGFDQIESGEFGEEVEVTQAPALSQRLSASGVSSSETFEMEINTRDGDTIKLSIYGSVDMSALSVDSQGEGVSSFNLQTSNGISYSISGDIDEGEKEAVSALMEQVDEIADDFYGGKVKDAYAHAIELGYDATEISGISLKMTQSVSAAVKTYSNVQDLQEGGVSEAKKLNSSDMATIGDYVRKIKSVLTAAETLFPEPEDIVKELFEGVVRITERNRAFQQQVQQSSINSVSLAGLVSSVTDDAQK